MSSESKQASSGGARAASGVAFQAQVFSHWAALAVSAAAPGMGLEPDASIESVGCETGLGMDDVGVILDTGGFILVQAKRGMRRVDKRSADFKSVAAQCVTVLVDGLPGENPRPVDPHRDRMVIAIDDTSSRSFDALGSVLRRLRTHPLRLSIEDAANSKAEIGTLKAFRAAIRDAWTQQTNEPLSDGTERLLLSVVTVRRYDFSEHGSSTREVVEMVGRTDVLDVIGTLTSFGLQTASERAWRRPTDIAQVVHRTIELHTSAAQEIDILRRITDDALRSLEPSRSITTPDGPLHLYRRVTTDLRSVEGDFLIVGAPGSGKSGVLADLAHDFDGDRVVLTIDSVPRDRTLAHMQWGLERDLAEVLTSWGGDGSRATLFLDGLDAHRDGTTWLGSLVAALDSTRWRIVASIREFQLIHSTQWRHLFRGTPALADVGSRHPLAAVRFAEIGPLDPEDLDAVAASSPRLAGAMSAGGSDFRELLSNPFNLSMAAELLEIRTEQTVSAARSQAELLGEYWRVRVTEGSGAFGRTEAIRSVLERMANAHSLESSLDGSQPGTIEAIEQLVARGVLVEAETRKVLSLKTTVRFRHHIVFDFALAAWIDEHPAGLLDVLRNDPNFIIYARPAVDFYLASLWDLDPSRRDFWTIYRAHDESDDPLTTAAFAAAVVRRLRDPSDIEFLISASSNHREFVDGFLSQASSAISALRPEEIDGVGAQIDVLDLLVGHAGQHLLDSLSAYRPTGLVQLIWVLNQTVPLPRASPAASAHALVVGRMISLACDDPTTHQWMGERSLYAAVAAASVDPNVVAALLRCLEPAVTEAWGLLPLRPVLRSLAALADVDQFAAEQLATAVFVFATDAERKSPIGSSLILPMHESWSQAHGGLKYVIVEEAWGEMTQRHLVSAVRIVCAAVQATPSYSNRTFEISYKDVRGSIRGFGGILDHGQRNSLESLATKTIDEVAQRYLRTDTNLLRILVAGLDHPGMWSRLIQKSENNIALSHELARLVISSPEMVLNSEIRGAVIRLLERVSPHLATDDHAALESMAHGIAMTKVSDERQIATYRRVPDQVLLALSSAHVQLPETVSRLSELSDLPELVAPRPVTWPDDEEAELADSDFRWERDGTDNSTVPEELLSALNGTVGAPTSTDTDELWNAVAVLDRADRIARSGGFDRFGESIRYRLSLVLQAIVKSDDLSVGTTRGEHVAKILVALLEEQDLPSGGAP